MPIPVQPIVPLLKGDTQALAERALFWHFPAYLQAGGAVEGIESRDPLFRTRPCSVVRVGDWKLHQYFEDGGLELYNLQTDIGETTNVAKTFPPKNKALLQQLTQWRRQINAPIPTEANPAFDAQAEAAAIQGKRKSGR